MVLRCYSGARNGHPQRLFAHAQRPIAPPPLGLLSPAGRGQRRGGSGVCLPAIAHGARPTAPDVHAATLYGLGVDWHIVDRFPGRPGRLVLRALPESAEPCSHRPGHPRDPRSSTRAPPSGLLLERGRFGQTQGTLARFFRPDALPILDTAGLHLRCDAGGLAVSGKARRPVLAGGQPLQQIATAPAIGRRGCLAHSRGQNQQGRGHCRRSPALQRLALGRGHGCFGRLYSGLYRPLQG